MGILQISPTDEGGRLSRLLWVEQVQTWGFLDFGAPCSSVIIFRILRLKVIIDLGSLCSETPMCAGREARKATTVVQSLTEALICEGCPCLERWVVVLGGSSVLEVKASKQVP